MSDEERAERDDAPPEEAAGEEPIAADAPMPDPRALPEESPEIKRARRRSQHVLVFSAVLFFLGVAGLQGIEIVKTREENRRKRRARAVAAELASAAASRSSQSPPPSATPLPAWTSQRRP